MNVDQLATNPLSAPTSFGGAGSWAGSAGSECRLHVHYEDEDLLVAEKPPGLLCVPGRGPDKQDCLLSRVQRSHPKALVVHRLDQATSGLVIFALNRPAQAALSSAFEQRAVGKRYLAWVGGLLAQPNEVGEIALPLSADWPQRPRQRVDLASGKPALTRWQVLQHASGSAAAPARSLLELRPTTGRTHQLRVHLAAIGHPIIGDLLYEGPTASRLMLHATQLRFPHPVTGQELRVLSPAPFSGL